jgi:ABC-2 type transport system permease protein
MNTRSNAVPEPAMSQVIAPREIPFTHVLYWSMRREFWENRYLYIAPLAVGAIALLGFLVATLGRVLAMADPARRAAVLSEPPTFAMGVIMAAAFLAAVFYSLEALQGERRDRSILFWKSLPISDLTTVLSKASIPIVFLPLFTFAITVVTQLVMAVLSSAVMAASGLSAATVWTNLFTMWLMLLYHLVTIHVLWHAPIYGWLLLVSAWARRAAFLWAALPPLAIGVVEKIAFNTTHFGAALGHRFSGGPEGVSFPEDGMTMHPLAHLTPGHFLISPGLWIGLALATSFIITAARLRRNRGPER